MSSTTVVRQTTTVTSSSGSASIVSVSFNTTFLTSINGILTTLEMVLGIIVFALGYYYTNDPSGLYLVLVSFAYWLMCSYFLFSGALSITGSLLPTTFFFFLFHVFGFVLYLAGGIAVLVKITGSSAAIAMGALGLIAGVCHIAHVAFLYKGPKL